MAENLLTFAVTYQYVQDMETRRTPHREDHLAWLRAQADAGRLVLAGAMLDPVDGALLVVRGESLHDVRRWLLDDPYARADLVQGVTVRRMGVAVGG